MRLARAARQRHADRMLTGPFYDGCCLVAMPGIGDPRFAHSVIALISHDSEGAMGIGIAHPTELPATRVFTDAGMDASRVDPAARVLIGGPVEPQRGLLLHSPDWASDESLTVPGRMAMSGSPAVLEAIARGEGPAHWLLALGYASWGAGQLEAEIADDAWHISTMDFADWFALEPEDRWLAMLRADGIEPGRIAIGSGRA